jgi:signal transduction histidine kinase
MEIQDWLRQASQALIEADILALFVTGTKGNILDANDVFLSMTGYSIGDIRQGILGLWNPAAIETSAVPNTASLVRTSLQHRDGRRLVVLAGRLEHAPGRDRIAWFAIDVSRLLRSEDRHHALLGRVLELHDDERRNIARELHDTTAQNLAALSMNLTMLADLPPEDKRRGELIAECANLAAASLSEVRTVSYLVHPPLLDELGLESALRAFIDGFTRRTGIQVRLGVQAPLGRFQSAAESALFRIAQEALTNVHLHSGSSSAEIALVNRGEAVELSVRDFGCGIPAQQLNPDGEDAGIGIASMYERARQLGGRLSIANASPGAFIRATIPRA